MTELQTHDVPAGIDTTDWRLRVTGAVARPLSLDRSDLSAFPEETITDDFACLEGWVAPDLSWRGVRVRTVLDRANPRVDDGYVLVQAMDDEYGCSLRRDRIEDALLAFELEGDELPVEHGGPARLVPVGADSNCWESVKWVSELELCETEPVTGDTAETIATGRLE